jgi:hypothetical protein
VTTYYTVTFLVLKGRTILAAIRGISCGDIRSDHRLVVVPMHFTRPRLVASRLRDLGAYTAELKPTPPTAGA